MKRTFASLVIAFTAICSIDGQQISLVTPDGAMSVFTDLNEAIDAAVDYSIISLSAGGFQINDNTKITKRLSIIGVGHKPDSPDGATSISGKLQFETGANGTTVMGVFVSGDVVIGTSSEPVNGVLVRYCNVNSIQVKHQQCQDIQINQNFLRAGSSLANAPVKFTNNVAYSISSINGVIDHNVVTNGISAINQTAVTNNVFIAGSVASNDRTQNNIFTSSVGSGCIVVSNWNDIFITPPTTVSVSADYHLKTGCAGSGAATDGSDVGIYGGTGFNDQSLPPSPHIVSKSIGEQTDQNGLLLVSMQVSN